MKNETREKNRNKFDLATYLNWLNSIVVSSPPKSNDEKMSERERERKPESQRVNKHLLNLFWMLAVHDEWSSIFLIITHSYESDADWDVVNRRYFILGTHSHTHAYTYGNPRIRNFFVHVFCFMAIWISQWFKVKAKKMSLFSLLLHLRLSTNFICFIRVHSIYATVCLLFTCMYVYIAYMKLYQKRLISWISVA